MPRIAENRRAAEPSSPTQKARRRRILRVARELAAASGLDRVQMQEVARDAEVAIGTLYRYFPSKTHLFTAVMADQVDQLADGAQAGSSGTGDPEGDVYQLLVGATRQLMRHPVLATALLQSANSADATHVPDAARIDATFRQLLLTTLGWERPTPGDRTAIWLLMQCWYGLLTSSLNGRTSPDEAEADLRTACAMLLDPHARRVADGLEQRTRPTDRTHRRRVS